MPDATAPHAPLSSASSLPPGYPVVAGGGTVRLGVAPPSFADVAAVARHEAQVVIEPAVLERVAAARQVVQDLADDVTPHYGVSTGFGALATKHIPVEMRAQLQRSLVRSHAAGSGLEIERDTIRALMFLRLKTLCSGHTGVAPSTVQAYADLLNAGLTPVVREYGSLGCSGDLAPLAHCALALMGEGQVRDRSGALLETAEAFRQHGLTPVQLVEKEGLALINGTDGMLGMLILSILDLRRLLASAEIAAALSVEGLMGSDAVFAPELMELRPHPGQAVAAANITTVMAGSPIRASHDGEDCRIVQDAYSLRCSPQVLGAARDTLAHAELVASRELAAAVDNPAVVGSRVQSNGNFHGAPCAYVLDFLAIVAADVASMSERRTDRFLDAARNHGLPPFLADDPGVDSGHMIAQYTQAALVSEMKRLAAPASVDSIPSSAMQEDHVSMGWSAGRKLRTSMDALARVLSVEVLTAARGIALREPLQPSPAAAAVLAQLRTDGWEGPGPDRYLSPEMGVAFTLVASGRLLDVVEKVTGPLHS